MRFKIDENLPVEIKEILIYAGHDAKTIFDEQLKGIKDLILAGIIKKENRILISLDLDFSDIRSYPPQEFSGIIVLRLVKQSKRQVIKVFRGILPLLEKEPLDQNLWIVEENRVRIRGKD